MYNLCYWFLIFFLFSIIGYIAEVIFCYIGSNKLTNRGFLHGPYCPIYGFGCLLIVIFLRPYSSDPIVLFVLSIFFTSILEYFTSWLMEKIFNDRWWDYSNKFGNINGRVCLFNSFCFGIGAILINYLLFPLLTKYLIIIPNKTLIIISIICFIIIFTDFLITTKLAFKFKQQLKIVKNYFEELKIPIPKIELFDKRLISKLEKYKNFPKHFMNAFPNLNINYKKEIKTLKDFAFTRKENKTKKNKS